MKFQHILLLSASFTTLASAIRGLRPQELLNRPRIVEAETTLASEDTFSHFNKDLLSLHKSLVEVESISSNELEVGIWLVRYLKEQGYTVEKQKVSEKRFNVLAYSGKERNTKVLLSSHMDTVPPFWPYKLAKNASSPTHTQIWGRGSVDAKGCIAAQTIAVAALLAHKKVHPDDVSLLFVVGEETGGDGMRAANALSLSPHTIIFGEPTEGRLASGHKGMLGFSLHVTGKAAHSGYPWLGVSANSVLVSPLAALTDLEARLPTSDKYGSTTLNIGRIEGGVAANVVAETASAAVAIRIASGSAASIRARVESAIAAATNPFVARGANVTLDFPTAGYGPVDIDHDVPGFGKSITVNYGTDIPNLDGKKGQKRYLYGPGSILVAHSDHEHLDVGELEEAVRGYGRLVMAALER
ncbi:acetylornithine deacetylase [Cryomyces antarcticus]|uniref:Peptidase M20 dimerisation domain-containing protein n=1 Tax=Cryomyces antarcticus TaxID=329879 RepID=A0ABR0LZ14_9PEZI|nr:hypothetical protein LTR39_000961 [Cryomyces antarcticus]KAK5256997.1 hypothetical protein LTR16_001885 [Cryomyces antarcticus]